jgi:uncharacterized protein
VEFEYDPNKSKANKEKHGIDFEEAKALWSDPRAVDVLGRSEGELRFIRIGRIGNRLWSAVFTERHFISAVKSERDFVAVRLISVRPARRGERRLYEGN